MAGYSRECANCEARWPQGYARCPACESMTTMVRQEPNRSQFQAREADFERRYVEREAKRIAQGHIAPEGLGRREAREIIRLERSLRDEAA